MRTALYPLYLLLLLGSIPYAYAQLRIGVRAMPTISFTSAYAEDTEQSDFDSKSHVLLGAGMFFELGQSERYRILLSLNYIPKRLHYKYSFTDGSNPQIGEEHHRLQYLSFGGGLRLLTDELFSASRIYFEAEPLFELKILDRRLSRKTEELITKITFADISIRLGAGIEREIGVDTAIFAGLAFNFGILNTVFDINNAFKDTLSDELLVKNHLLGLNFGIKF